METSNSVKDYRIFILSILHAQVDFQTDACQMTPSANQMVADRVSANHRATSKYQFGKPSQKMQFRLHMKQLYNQIQLAHQPV